MIKSSQLSELPPISGIYRVWHQESIVYVGQAKNLKHRWVNGHHIQQELLRCYGADWTIDWVEISPNNLVRAEAYAYRVFQPKLNKKNPSSSLGQGT